MITSETSSVPGFVAELVRAANQVDRLTAGEIERLLLRAMTTVRDLREQAGIPGSGTEDDAIVRLDIVAKGVVTFSPAFDVTEAGISPRNAQCLIFTIHLVGDDEIRSAVARSVPMNKINMAPDPVGGIGEIFETRYRSNGFPLARKRRGAEQKKASKPDLLNGVRPGPFERSERFSRLPWIFCHYGFSVRIRLIRY
ncbi:hypothetical protein [Rhizobium leguminosarum]|uniref:hypothetical protein n=1 Tax=Rhizobium leguminosarum TaxID=384 RepID=UPI0021BC2E4D|nr:hypothetical protein [Rhizobium leguminosarum]